jgi:methyltransferase (TIGR00027 family)
MNPIGMTALISAFARAYHAENNEVTIFCDTISKKLLTEEEYNGIASAMTDGMAYFGLPADTDRAAALRQITDRHLSPIPLARAAFAEQTLQTAVRVGARQYVILAAGYDTFAYRQPAFANRLSIWELDVPAVMADKQMRLERAGIPTPANVHRLCGDLAGEGWRQALLESGFDRDAITVVSLLGLTYYLPKEAFAALLKDLRWLLPTGSTLVFEYPDALTGRMNLQRDLADGAQEPMTAVYSYAEMERLLAEQGFSVYEHLNPSQMTAQYFARYQRACPEHPMTATEHVNYVCAVKTPV